MDEDDLKWMANEKNILLLLNSSMETLALQPPDFRKLNHSSEMQHDALMHREGLKGYLRQDGYMLFDLAGCPSTYLENIERICMNCSPEVYLGQRSIR